MSRKIIDHGSQAYDLEPALRKPGVAFLGRKFLNSTETRISGCHAAIFDDFDGAYIIDLSWNGSWYKVSGTENLVQIYNAIINSDKETPNMIAQENAKLLGKVDLDEIARYREKSLQVKDLLEKSPDRRKEFAGKGTLLKNGMQLFLGQKDMDKAYVYSQA